MVCMLAVDWVDSGEWIIINKRHRHSFIQGCDVRYQSDSRIVFSFYPLPPPSSVGFSSFPSHTETPKRKVDKLWEVPRQIELLSLQVRQAPPRWNLRLVNFLIQQSAFSVPRQDPFRPSCAIQRDSGPCNCRARPTDSVVKSRQRTLLASHSPRVLLPVSVPGSSRGASVFLTSFSQGQPTSTTPS